jgi:hypothetical protein
LVYFQGASTRGEKLKEHVKRILKKIIIASLKSAIKEQALDNYLPKLMEAVPDISDQYTYSTVEGEYLNLKCRGLHAFQVRMFEQLLKKKGLNNPKVVDIGDSSGTHMRYLRDICGCADTLSLNLDDEAVLKIKGKGLAAINCRAEKLAELEVKADIFCTFEMLEHLSDPVRFLYDLTKNEDVKYLYITVPYIRQSRVGLSEIRLNVTCDFLTAEGCHIFELSPDDWEILFRFAGWKVEFRDIYRQYPRFNLLFFTKYLWKRFDFEGFYGVVLSKDDTYSKKYIDW